VANRAAWHSNSSLFSNNTGTSSWWWWLGKTKTSFKISEWNKVLETDTMRWATQIRRALVYQRITPNPRGLSWPNWESGYVWTRSSLKLI
jgi:hypothetical protein